MSSLMVAFSIPCQILIPGYTGSRNLIRSGEEQYFVPSQRIGDHDRVWLINNQSFPVSAPAEFTNHSTASGEQQQERLAVSGLYSLLTLIHVFAYSPPSPLLYPTPSQPQRGCYMSLLLFAWHPILRRFRTTTPSCILVRGELKSELSAGSRSLARCVRHIWPVITASKPCLPTA